MVTVTFVDADTNVLLGVMEFELGTAAEDVIAYAQTTFARPGYTLAASGYTADGAKAQTVTVKYSVITYTATFIADGVVVGTVPFTVESEVPLEGEPEVPAKEGYTGVWKEYTIKAADMEIHAVYRAVEDDGGSLLWILWVVLALIVIAAVVVIIVLKRKGSTPPPAAPIIPAVEPEVEAEPEIESEIVAAPVEDFVEIVEDVTVEEADELMTDDTAMTLVATKKAAAVVGAKAIVNISRINDAFADGDVVTVEALKEKRLIPNNTGKVKILAGGHLNKALTVEAHAFSVQAVKMITLTGGSVTQIVTE
jgi:ribosomal protein L18E